jgi:pimeloyl-ACP methyl ester carboxylesterase
MPGPAHPGYFGPSGAECFGWLHLPSGTAQTDMGLVICGPFGHEDQSAYRSLRQLAIEAAALGVPTLRYDPPGCGDSIGAEGVDDHPASWRRAADAAIDALRARSGVGRVCLVGVRTGVLTAAQAATDRADVIAFVALAPVLRGRAFLREALMRSPNAPADHRAGFETGGHLVTARARAELNAIDLHTASRPPAAEVLIATPSAGPETTRWQVRLATQGARVDSVEAPELTPMLQSDTTVVKALVDRVAAWVAARAGPLRAVLPPQATTEHLSSSVLSDRVRETAIRMTAGGIALFGILAEPANGGVQRAVVLVNTGSARRIGASRMHVAWARDLARTGIAVLRVDLPGLGDSEPQPGIAPGEAYEIDAAPGIAASLALLASRHPGVACTLVGTCSGAYQAYRAALGGAPVQGLVLINQAAYRWTPGMLERPGLAMQLSWRRYARLAGRPVVTGGGVLALFGSACKWWAIEALMTLYAGLRELARLVGRPLPGDAGAALQALARRGMALHILTSEDDDAGPLLELEAGRALATLRARGQLQIEQIAGADHIFTTRDARARLGAALARILQAGGDPTPASTPGGRPSR